MGVALASVTAALVLAAPMGAQAGVTCKMVKSWCTADRFEREESTTRSVPEPGTLMLLAAGVTAVGGAALRRRKSKK